MSKQSFYDIIKKTAGICPKYYSMILLKEPRYMPENTILLYY